MSKFRLPNDTQRVAVIGKTGSGKTQGSAWLLAQRNFDAQPWVVLDFKRDELLNSLPGIKHVDIESNPPKKPGLYIAHPMPEEHETMENFLWKVWERGKTGLYIDESYMIDKRSKALQAILTQGRSKRIPMIMATQRPVEVSRFVFSEADFIQLYQLTDIRDTKTVKQFMPMPIENPLPRYHSYWYDNGGDYKCTLNPVPEADTIRAMFAATVGPSRPRF